jgi:N-acetylglutamate synthase-like GNAT family acetyltransferase
VAEQESRYFITLLPAITRMIKVVESQDEREQLDELLWKVLWKPLGLPRDTRNKFALPGKEMELIAVEAQMVTAGLVVNWTDENELEIRHLAVEKTYQHRLTGTSLLSRLFDLIKKSDPVRVRAYVRNTSYPFFEKCGFRQVSEDWIEHPDFKKHGIHFKLVEKYV